MFLPRFLRPDLQSTVPASAPSRRLSVESLRGPPGAGLVRVRLKCPGASGRQAAQPAAKLLRPHTTVVRTGSPASPSPASLQPRQILPLPTCSSRPARHPQPRHTSPSPPSLPTPAIPSLGGSSGPGAPWAWVQSYTLRRQLEPRGDWATGPGGGTRSPAPGRSPLTSEPILNAAPGAAGRLLSAPQAKHTAGHGIRWVLASRTLRPPGLPWKSLRGGGARPAGTSPAATGLGQGNV